MRALMWSDWQRRGAPQKLKPKRLVELATIEGAKLLGIGERTGSLTPGKRADLITIRTGDIYALESWQDRVIVAEIQGASMSAGLLAELRGRGFDPQPHRTYLVATTGFVAEDEPATFLGRPRTLHPRRLLRDVTIAQLRASLGA